MAKYAADFGIQVDDAAWEIDYKEVVRDLARNIERVTGIALTGWDSPSRGGICFQGRRTEGGEKLSVWMRPNYVPESGDWGMQDYKAYTVIAAVFGTNLQEVEELENAILASREIGATLLQRETVRTGGRSELRFSLKDGGSRN